MTETYVGLTWDHPRGRDALVAARAHAQSVGIDLSWDVQSLEGFESAPLEELASRYDLLVIDHPHLGDAVRSGCLRPMEDVVGVEAIADVARRAVGPSLASYRMADRTWALPLDAATQVAARRPDLLEAPTASWDDVVDASHEAPVALSLSGPHAYLTFASLCRSHGASLADGASESIVDPDAGAWALETLRDLARRAPTGSEGQNPIALLERMTSTDEIALVPLVYGYSGYAARGRRRAVSFDAAPTGRAGVPGSTIGGTGITVTARATVTDGLRAHLVWLLSDAAQVGFIPSHSGQPSVAAAWESPVVNDPVGDFYTRTRDTIDRAWIRPRFAGFSPLQLELSGDLREAIVGTEPAASVLRRLTRRQNAAPALTREGAAT